ncbi:uncharacterized protein LOC133849697 [Drosophila sulfurigaster albostrigata]|uniref:uncharacterized protein LOC133849697 n=1 Tax=Drosophila sulfurigaster albostrigata TaxID=89887 RepID=UPI002D21A8CB|nr:uncharacterized protein LOC133849697 [Drosophila sulfurigaster albostrigata]
MSDTGDDVIEVNGDLRAYAPFVSTLLTNPNHTMSEEERKKLNKLIELLESLNMSSANCARCEESVSLLTNIQTRINKAISKYEPLLHPKSSQKFKTSQQKPAGPCIPGPQKNPTPSLEPISSAHFLVPSKNMEPIDLTLSSPPRDCAGNALRMTPDRTEPHYSPWPEDALRMTPDRAEPHYCPRPEDEPLYQASLRAMYNPASEGESEEEGPYEEDDASEQKESSEAAPTRRLVTQARTTPRPATRAWGVWSTPVADRDGGATLPAPSH